MIENNSKTSKNASDPVRLDGWHLYAGITAAILMTIALSGCGNVKAATKLPDTQVVVSRPVQQDVPVQSEWVATLDGYVNAEILEA